MPDAPFLRDRHTTLLAHFDAESCDADYSRWDGRAGGWRLQTGVPGRFGSGVELPGSSGQDNPRISGAPILFRGASNCRMQAGTCEFWMRTPDKMELLDDRQDRYLLTILPESLVGYGQRPSVHLVLRTHAATKSLQFAVNTNRISWWYSHLNGARIADGAKTILQLPLDVLSAPGWHHIVCSWSMEGDGRAWLLVDGEGVTDKLTEPSEPGLQIPCYKIFLGGSYFPEIYCPSARGVLDEFRILDQTVADRLAGFQETPPRMAIDEQLIMQGEDLCRYFLDFTARLQMGGAWEAVYTWPSLLPDESPGSYAALAEDAYSLREVAPAYLRAYEVFGDDRYLRVAENCGQFLVKIQDENGAWCQGYIVMPDGAHPVAPGVGSIEEGTQTDPLAVLFWLWRLTGRPEYRDAAEKSAEFVRRGQKPDGSWPLAVNSRTMKPGGGYSGYSTLNDGATLWGMKSMLLGWHLTGEPKYLDALEKAGEWVIKSQLGGTACGWAEQYDDQGEPAWARRFEPPVTSVTAMQHAADALFLMFDLTGDEKYLAPLRRCVEWGRNMPEDYRGFSRYDPETGEPLVAVDFQIHRFSDPDFEAKFSNRRRRSDPFRTLQQRLDARKDGPLVPSRRGLVPRSEFERRPQLDTQEIAKHLDAAASAMTKPLAHLDAFQRGEFPAGTILNDHPRHGRHFWPGKAGPDVQRILDFIQSAKAAVREAGMSPPLYDRGTFGYVDPERDWYETPLLHTKP